MTNSHSWKFFRAGGFDQVRLESGADLLALDQLDQKLWVALASPTTGLEFDPRTLALIDTDGDGRIRAPEIISAAKWAATNLKDPNDLLKPSGTLSLAAINDASDEGKNLLSSARHILRNLGKPNAPSLTVEDTLDAAKIFSREPYNGDGIVPPEAAEDEGVRNVIADIIVCLGGETDGSGKPGVNRAKLDQFFTEAHAYAQWWKQGDTQPGVLPLREATEGAAAACERVRTKADDYFARCRLAAYDPRAVNALNRDEKDYQDLAAQDLTLTSSAIASLPLAHVAPDKPLLLKDGLNPAWAADIAKFRNELVRPLLGDKDELTETDWAALSTSFVPFQTWQAAKKGGIVEKLGIKRVQEILAGDHKSAIESLIAKDLALEPEANALTSLERLVRYHRDLYQLLNNFVSFRDFYSRKRPAIFQAGILYLDQRSYELCLFVQDPARHAILASLAGTYLAYCDCTRKASGDKLQIVAAVTNGDSDNLMVSRNGIFYDRKGLDWDATITKIIDNPISIRQAFWSPYKKAARMIQEMIAKRAAAADAASTTRLVQATTKVETAAVQPPGPAPEPPKKVDPGLVAALSVGAAGVGAALGAILTGFLNLRWLMPLGVLAILLIISGPAMLFAWLKLRRRNLGPLLDANGWAINAKAKINVPFGKALTKMAVLPPGAQRDLTDPFAEKKKPWGLFLVLLGLLVLVLLGWWFGWFDKFLPDYLHSIR